MARFIKSGRILSAISRRTWQIPDWYSAPSGRGMIFIPSGTADRQLEKADQEAAEKAAANDIRPDAKETAAQDRAASDSKEKETEKRSPKNRS